MKKYITILLHGFYAGLVAQFLGFLLWIVMPFNSLLWLYFISILVSLYYFKLIKKDTKYDLISFLLFIIVCGVVARYFIYLSIGIFFMGAS